MLTKVPKSDLRRIENGLEAGTPDVNGCMWGVDFWLELKVADIPKKDPSQIVKIPHFTQQQRLWIRRRGMAGGRVYVLLKLFDNPRPATFLLFDWKTSVTYVGFVPADELRSRSLFWGLDFSIDAWRFALHLHLPSSDDDTNDQPPFLRTAGAITEAPRHHTPEVPRRR